MNGTSGSRGEIEKNAIKRWQDLFASMDLVDSEQCVSRDAESAERLIRRIGGHQGRRGTSAFVYMASTDFGKQKHTFSSGGLTPSEAYEMAKLLKERFAPDLDAGQVFRFADEAGNELAVDNEGRHLKNAATIILNCERNAFGIGEKPHFLWKTVNNGVQINFYSTASLNAFKAFIEQKAQEKGIGGQAQIT